MAIQVPILVATSGVRALGSIVSALAKSVGLGAKTAVRATARKVAKEMVKVGTNIAKEARQQVAPARGFTAAGTRLLEGTIRSSFKTLEKTTQDRILRVVNWFIPDELFALLGLTEDVDAQIAAEQERIRAGILAQGQRFERVVTGVKERARFSLFNEFFAEKIESVFDAEQLKLEREMSELIFGPGRSFLGGFRRS